MYYLRPLLAPLPLVGSTGANASWPPRGGESPVSYAKVSGDCNMDDNIKEINNNRVKSGHGNGDKNGDTNLMETTTKT